MTMGTAPRSPAHDRNACSRHGSRNGSAHRTHGQRPGQEGRGGADEQRLGQRRPQPRRARRAGPAGRTARPRPAAPSSREAEHRPAVRQRRVAQDQRGEVDGEEAADVQRLAGGEGQQAQGHGRQRVEAGGRQRRPAPAARARPARSPGRAPRRRRARSTTIPRRLQHATVVRPGVGRREHHEHDDRRVVEPRLRLERRADRGP